MKNARTFIVLESASISYGGDQGSGSTGSSQCLESDLKTLIISLRDKASHCDSLHISMRQNRPHPIKRSSSLSHGSSQSGGWSSEGISFRGGNEMGVGRGRSHVEDSSKRHAKIYGLPSKPEERFIWKTVYMKDESSQDIVCYIPEQGESVYTNHDIYELCHHDHELAAVVFDRCNGERPAEILSQGLEKLMPGLKKWEVECIACKKTEIIPSLMTYSEVIEQRKMRLKAGRIQIVCKPCFELMRIDDLPGFQLL